MPSRECCLNERGTIRACAAVKLVVSCSPKEDVAAGSGGRVLPKPLKHWGAKPMLFITIKSHSGWGKTAAARLGSHHGSLIQLYRWNKYAWYE